MWSAANQEPEWGGSASAKGCHNPFFLLSFDFFYQNEWFKNYKFSHKANFFSTDFTASNYCKPTLITSNVSTYKFWRHLGTYQG